MKVIVGNYETGFIEGYAQAIQDCMFKLVGFNTCGKMYDPCKIEGGTLYSYAFNLKGGGRQHELSDYLNKEEITDLMLKEFYEFIEENK